MEALYEDAPYCTHFSAVVRSCTPEKRGWAVCLDQTAFYPEGGGQPYDQGTLNGVPVLEVHRRDGAIVHTCAAPLEVGAPVEGVLDWARRFDLMQQHSGEHIFSGLAHRHFGCENVGFHLGAEVVTIDLDRPLDGEQVAFLEQEANRYLWENHPVEVLYPTPEELAALEYRSKKALTGQVRIVSFPGADTCACCGTHVAHSGEIGLLKVLSWQNFRAGIRMELVCGGRALGHLSRVGEQNRRISNLLSAKVLETAPAVERLLEENQRLSSRLLTLEERLWAQLAEGYAGGEDVVLFEEGLTPDGLRRLAGALRGVCTGRCACFSGEDQGGYKYALTQVGADLRPLCQELNGALRGRGGGKADFVQGSLQATRAEIETFLQSH